LPGGSGRFVEKRCSHSGCSVASHRSSSARAAASMNSG